MFIWFPPLCQPLAAPFSQLPGSCFALPAATGAHVAVCTPAAKKLGAAPAAVPQLQAKEMLISLVFLDVFPVLQSSAAWHHFKALSQP